MQRENERDKPRRGRKREPECIERGRMLVGRAIQALAEQEQPMKLSGTLEIAWKDERS